MKQPLDYVPEQGDIVWVNCSPQAGREQSGHRPVVVLSPKKMNAITGLMFCCPITTKAKGYPFEIAIEDETGSVVLADQIKTFDWSVRAVKYKGKISNKIYDELIKLIMLIITRRP